MKKIKMNEILPALLAGNVVLISGSADYIIDDIAEILEDKGFNLPDFWENKTLIKGKIYALNIERIYDFERDEEIDTLNLFGAIKAKKEGFYPPDTKIAGFFQFCIH